MKKNGEGLHHLHYDFSKEIWKGKESESPWHKLISFGEVTPGTVLAREAGNHVPQMLQYLKAMVHNSRRNNIMPQRTYQVNEMLERFFTQTLNQYWLQDPSVPKKMKDFTDLNVVD